MKIDEYLEKNQPIPYKIFKNSLERNSFFHAYLLNGALGTPLLEIAKFLAKSMICKNRNPFACNICTTCNRIDNNHYGNLIIIDGKLNTIKKDDINNIIDIFSNTSSERNEYKIYIINLIENMTVDASNALLKFLEEPPENTYAILTTENKFKILPTILSRTEIINFSLLNQNRLISDSISLGTKDDDAEILSFFYNDPITIKEKSLDDNYLESKSDILTLLNCINDKESLKFTIESNILPKLTSKEEARFFFDIFTIFIKEALKYKINKTTLLTSYVNILNSLIKEVNNLDDAILILMNSRNELNYNLNINLLVLHTLCKIFGV
ncbi:MAG TPA: hypothetical protein DEA28_03510 [Firmicutes bacterium]|nr:hypothetical protein [Bacillota bacterium]